jgi:molybdate/tungstate transport system substrate-binding protein
LFLLIALTLAVGYAGKRASAGPPEERQLIIFHAASLARPFEILEKQFESEHPGVDVIRESSDSQTAIRKVTELHRPADILISADYALLPQLAMPACADWAAAFARNRIVIAYTDKSKYRNEINANNWYKILLRKDVNFGYCNPDLAPVGYRTLIVWRLADLHYHAKPGGKKISDALLAKCPQEYVRPDCNQLLPLLESMSLDYIFEYESVARQHNLQCLRLPAQIDLSDAKYKDFYARASAVTSGKKPGEKITQKGTPTIYGLTIVKDAPHPKLALAFVQFLFSSEGRKVMAEGFQEPIAPAQVRDPRKVPAGLSKLVVKGAGL